MIQEVVDNHEMPCTDDGEEREEEPASSVMLDPWPSSDEMPTWSQTLNNHPQETEDTARGGTSRCARWEGPSRVNGGPGVGDSWQIQKHTVTP